jgi:multidrug efflux pump subunit AcrA (membrane-fusion protein)
MTTLVVGLSALVAGGCPGAQSASQGGPPPPKVKVTTATPADVESFSDYLATIKSRRSVEIRPQVEGHVARILVKPGDVVAANATLIQVDNLRQEAAVRSARAATGIAQADVERAVATLAQFRATRPARVAAVKLADENHKRSEELVKTKIVPQTVFDQTEAALATARAEVDALDRQIAAQVATINSFRKNVAQSVATAQRQDVELQYYRVVAPFPGTVGDIPVKVGDLVTPQTLLTTVDDENNAQEAYVSVPVEEVPRVKHGLTVRLVDSTSTQTLSTGQVSFISPRIDPATQSVLVTATLPKEKLNLRPLQSVRARMVWSSQPGLRVPVTAVQRLAGQTFLFVMAEGEPATVRQKPVKLGPIDGDAVQVVEGLKAGERYVHSGIQKLRDKSAVTIER